MPFPHVSFTASFFFLFFAPLLFSLHPLSLFFLFLSLSFFGQRPRQGTESCRMGRAPLAGPLAPLAGPRASLAGPQAPLASPLAPLAGPQTPLAGPQAPLVGPHTLPTGSQAPLAGPQNPLIKAMRHLLMPNFRHDGTIWHNSVYFRCRHNINKNRR